MLRSSIPEIVVPLPAILGTMVLQIKHPESYLMQTGFESTILIVCVDARAANHLAPVQEAPTVFGMRTKFSKTAIFVLFVSCLIIIPTPASARGETSPSPSEYKGPLKNSMVQIYSSAGFCSGAVVFNSRAVLTAAHCVVKSGSLAADVSVEISGKRFVPYVIAARKDYQSPNSWCATLQKDSCTATNGDFALLWFLSPLPAVSLNLPPCAKDPSCFPQNPPGGEVLVLGFQMTGANGVIVGPPTPLDSHLRPPLGFIKDPENSGATKPVSPRLFSCTIPASFRLKYSNNSIGGRCGMIQGASGGVMISNDGSKTILGVTSGVYDRGLWNLFVPGASIRSAVWGETAFLQNHRIKNPTP